MHLLKVKTTEYGIPCKWDTKGIINSHTSIRQNIFESKAGTKHEKGPYAMKKGSIHHEEIILVNIYIPNIGAPKNEAHITRTKWRALL